MADEALWERVSELYARALELPATERAAFLESAGADDPAARAEVEGLLAVSGDAERYFDAVANEMIPRTIAAIDGDDTTRLGRRYGRYQVIETIGRGGMGVVYRAEDTRLKRTAALKFLPPSLLVDPEARARLWEEARAASTLDDPNICTIFGVEETADGEAFIAMAYYAGETLAQRIGHGSVPIEQGLAIATGVTRGLAAAHSRGITHRDLTPRNVMLAAGDRVKILDFGLARVAGQPGAASGTPAYMAPEQIRGEPTGPAADVWSLGVTLYELFTGHRPFDAPDTVSLLEAIQRGDLKPPRAWNPRLPEALDRLILSMLAQDPGARPPDAAAVLRVIEPLRGGRKSRPGLLGSAVLATLAVVAVAFWASRNPNRAPRNVPATRVVLLPFAFDSTNADATYFAAGFQEGLAGELARIRGLAVVTWTSALPGENTPKSRRRLSDALGAVAVLEGEVIGADSLVLRLHAAADDRILWARGRNFGTGYISGADREFAVTVATALGISPANRDSALRVAGAFATDPRTGHVYEAVPVTVDWYAAETAAEGRLRNGVRGHLATITSAAENDFIRTALPQTVAGRYWLGGFRATRSGSDWRWITGEPFGFASWNRGEPNDYLGEDGLQFVPSASGGAWNDIDRTSGFERLVHGFLVEYDAPVGARGGPAEGRPPAGRAVSGPRSEGPRRGSR